MSAAVVAAMIPSRRLPANNSFLSRVLPCAGLSPCIRLPVYAQYRDMIVRVSSAKLRGLLVLFALLLLASLSYSGIRNALAAHDVELNTREGYERAVRLAPDDARNWYLLGRYSEYNLDTPDTQLAIRDYQNSLALNPHSADTWLELATAFEAEADLASARQAFHEAKQAYPLSPDVSWRYGNFLLRRGELDAALAEIKQAVEQNPKLGPAAFALALRVEPNVRDVLDRALPASPDALSNVINSLSDQQQTAQALLVWSRLASLEPRISLEQSYPLLEVLLQRRQMADALRVWNEALGFAGILRPQDIAESLVWDGSFESNVRGGGFAWRYPLAGGAVQVALDSREKHSGNQSLRLRFNGLSNVDFSDVCQYIAVQPSSAYRFSAWVRTDSLSTDQGVRFSLASLGDAGNAVDWTDDVRGTEPWTQVSLPWNSKADVHGLRVCVMRAPSAKFDNKIRGVAWVDDVALVPQLAEHAGR